MSLHGTAPEEHLRSYQPNSSSSAFKWHTVVLVLVTWIVATAVQWGLFTARLDENSRRISNLEQTTVTRMEYSDFRSELRDRLVRMEAKIDQMMRRAEIR